MDVKHRHAQMHIQVLDMSRGEEIWSNAEA